MPGNKPLPWEGWVDSDQGLPRWTRVMFWVRGFLGQLGGHGCRVHDYQGVRSPLNDEAASGASWG